MSKLRITLSVVVTIIALYGSAFGTVWFADSRYASASSHQELALKVNMIRLRSTLDDSLSALYFYKKQFRKYPNDLDIELKVIEAEEDVFYLKSLLDEIDDKKEALKAKIKKVINKTP